MIIQKRSQFVQMLFSVQAGREINEEVFACESNEFPPSLTKRGGMYFGSTSNLLPGPESSKNVPPTNTNDPAVDGMVLDGCVMLRFIPPDTDSYISDVC